MMTGIGSRYWNLNRVRVVTIVGAGLVGALSASSLTLSARADEEVKVAKNIRYSDDFKTQEKLDNDAEGVTNLKVFPAFGLSSVNGSPGYAIWDTDTVLPNHQADAEITLLYTGMANGPAALRGVTFSVSMDGKEWKVVSTNEFDKPVKFKGKFIKATIMWVQAGGPNYGCLRSFSIKAPAAPAK